MTRRGQSVVFAVIVTLGAASLAHAQAVIQGAATTVAGVTVDDVLGRLMSFDRNRDGKVARVELAERMQALVTRGDVDGDGALDRTEIGALVAPVPRPTFRVQAQTVGAYGFADQFQTSSQPRVDGAIDDLRLESSTRERAIADAYIQTLERTASEELVQKMERVLTPAQMTSLKSLVANAEAQAARSTVSEGSGSGRIDAAAFVQRFQLAAPERTRATAIAEEYKGRIQLDQPYQAEMLDQLSAILNPEEVDNLRAALQRRPLIATSNLVRLAPPLRAPVEMIRDAPSPPAGLIRQ
jgi:hypothetical protein